MGTTQTNRLPTPEQLLAVLDQALATPGVTVLKLRLLRHLLAADGPVDTYSDADIAGLLACSERTAREAKQWTRQFFAAMHVCSTPEEVPEVQNIHASQPDPASLAREQLQSMGWGVLDGHQVQDFDALIDSQGALNVLYAIWCSQGKRIQNPPAFVTWWLRQGHQAPEGWLPAELRTQEPPEPQAQLLEEHRQKNENPAPRAPAKGGFDGFAGASYQEYPGRKGPQTAAELQPLWEDLLAYIEPQVRPASFQAWFEPLALVAVEEPDILCLWAPTTAHADWVEGCYDRLLRRAGRAVGYRSYRITVHRAEEVA